MPTPVRLSLKIPLHTSSWNHFLCPPPSRTARDTKKSTGRSCVIRHEQWVSSCKTDRPSVGAYAHRPRWMGRRNFEQRHVTYKRVVEPMCRRRDADVEESSAADKISKFAFGVFSFLFVFIITKIVRITGKKNLFELLFSAIFITHYFALYSPSPHSRYTRLQFWFSVLSNTPENRWFVPTHKSTALTVGNWPISIQ